MIDKKFLDPISLFFQQGQVWKVRLNHKFFYILAISHIKVLSFSQLLQPLPTFLHIFLWMFCHRLKFYSWYVFLFIAEQPNFHLYRKPERIKLNFCHFLHSKFLIQVKYLLNPFDSQKFYESLIDYFAWQANFQCLWKFCWTIQT